MIKTITDTELLTKDIPPVNFLVQDFLPATGLSVLGGAPKMGKSLMTTSLAVAISGGDRFLALFEMGLNMDVLLLGLEDTEQRAQTSVSSIIKCRIKT